MNAKFPTQDPLFAAMRRADVRTINIHADKQGDDFTIVKADGEAIYCKHWAEVLACLGFTPSDFNVERSTLNVQRSTPETNAP